MDKSGYDSGILSEYEHQSKSMISNWFLSFFDSDFEEGISIFRFSICDFFACSLKSF